MIQALSDEFKCNTVSSTNNPVHKIDETEGRVQGMTATWRRWANNIDEVEYIQGEDRFIYRFIQRLGQ